MNNKPQTPQALVTVDKKHGREVLVGIVDANRQITDGFTSDWPATVNYRILRHGPFSVLVGTRLPVEIRVMMDGKLLCEQFLDPLPQPATAHTKSDVLRKVGEMSDQPQPFFIAFDDQGANLNFIADHRSSDEHLRLQLNPEPLNPVNGPALVRVGEVPDQIWEAKADVTMPHLLLVAPTPAAQKSSDPEIITTPEELDQQGDCTGTDIPGQATSPAKLIPAQVDAQGTVLPSEHHIDAPLPTKWAPSSGLVAIGVRMVQTLQEGEPPMPPDGFDYVLFQLNTFADNARVRANLHSRIKLAPRIKFPELVEGEDHRDHQSSTPAGGCGHSHGHNPRRFR